MSTTYKLRLTLEETEGAEPRDAPTADEREAQLKSFVGSVAPSYLIVREGADGEVNRLHCHAILVGTKYKNPAALRVAFTRALKWVQGNADYSIGVVDDADAHIRYLCKGAAADQPPVVVAKCGMEFGDDDLSSAHGLFWENNRSMKAASKKRASAANKNVVAELTRRCKAKGLTAKDAVDVSKAYLDYYTEQDRGVSKHHGVSTVRAVLLKLPGSEEYRRDLACAIAVEALDCSR